MVDVEKLSVSSNEFHKELDEATPKQTKVDVESIKGNKQSSELKLDRKVPILAESTVSVTQSAAEDITPMSHIETVEEKENSEVQYSEVLHDLSQDTLNTEVKLAVTSIDHNDSSTIDSDMETNLTDVESIILAHESLLEMGRKAGVVLFVSS